MFSTARSHDADFVAGFNASATGGTVNTISFTGNALIASAAAIRRRHRGHGILEGGTGTATGSGTIC